MQKNILLIVSAILLSGCTGMGPMKKNAQRTFIYDYQIESVDKTELWVRARDYFASTFGDSRSVLRVQDKEAGSLIGKGVAGWVLVMETKCYSEYKLRFQSKDNKARLQLELSEGVPSYSTCSGWPLPSESGYQTIVADFLVLSNGLEKALSKASDFSDF